MKIKKCFALVLSLVLSLSSFSFAFAASSEDEYIKFNVNQEERMDSNGEFEFLIRHSVKSDTFKAQGDSIKISVSGKVWDLNTKNFLTTSDTFTVKLCTSLGIEVDSFTVDCDGKDDVVYFDVKDGKKYHLTIVSNQDYTGTGYNIKGYGKVSPVTVL